MRGISNEWSNRAGVSVVAGFGMLVGVSCFSDPLSAAEGIRTLPDSARSMGMAGGRFANLDDSTVTRSNPANLTQLAFPEVMLSFQAWHGSTDFDGVTGVDDSMIKPWKFLGSLYAAMPISDSVTVGLGLTAPFGVGISWERDSPFRYSAPHDALVQTIAINPAIGIEVNEHLSLGFGFDILYSSIELDQIYPWFAAGFPGARDGDMDFEGSGWGIGAYLGMTVRITDNFRVAVTGRLPVNIDYDGDFTISDIPDPVRGVFSRNSDFETDIKHPGSIGVGIGWDVNKRLTVGADYEWIQNSTHDDLPLDIGSNQALLPTDRLVLDWRDSWTLSFGLEYEVNDRFTFRSGYMFSKSPFRDRTYSPVIPTNDRHIFSCGLGYAFEKSRLDLAYSFVPLEDRSVRKNQDPTFNGDYEAIWHVISLSYTRHF